MRQILAIGCGLRKEDYQISHKIIQSIFPHIGIDSINTVDLDSYSLKLDNVDVVFIFGAKAKRNFDVYGKLSTTYIELPDFKKLEPTPDNNLIRKEVWRKLKEFRERVESGVPTVPAQQKINLETKELPDFNVAQLKALLESLRLKQIAFWQGKTKNGKSLIIANEALSPNSADIVLTFAEFYTLKSMTELLGLEQVEFVNSDENDRNRSS